MFDLFLHYPLSNVIRPWILSSSHVAYLAPRTDCALLCFKKHFQYRIDIFPVIRQICIRAACLICKFPDIPWKGASELIEAWNHSLKMVSVLYSSILNDFLYPFAFQTCTVHS